MSDTDGRLIAFLSYSHDSLEHKARVLELSDRLRSDGVASSIDQYEFSPPEGWPAWMARRIAEADFVLVVCTEPYARRLSGAEEPGKGHGAIWEGQIITQEIYEAGRNAKFIPVIFSSSNVAFIPDFLRPVTRYDLSETEGYELLYRHLTAQPRVEKPPLGTVRVLSASSRNPLSDERPEQPARRSEFDPETMVLLTGTNGSIALLPAQRVEGAERVTLDVVPQDEHHIAFLDDLRQGGRDPTGLAYGTTGLLVRLERATQRRDLGKELWTLEYTPEKLGDGFMSEMAFEQLSANAIAELRARRILLNEQLDSGSKSELDRMNSSMLEVLIRGLNAPIEITESPFPALYAELGTDPAVFLKACKLFAVLWLKISRTVEHILQLNLALTGSNQMSVAFRGRRAKVYTNEPAHEFALQGSCDLTGHSADFEHERAKSE